MFAMKDSSGILFVVIGLVALALFWGLLTGLKKSFSFSKPQTVDSTQTLQEQRQRSQDIVERQKRLMEDQRQRLRDMQRR